MEKPDLSAFLLSLWSRLRLTTVCAYKLYLLPYEPVTVSVRIGARLIEALNAAGATKHVLGLVSVERVRRQFLTTL